MISRSHLAFLLVVAAACSSGSESMYLTGTWANDNTVVVATDSAVTIRFACRRVVVQGHFPAENGPYSFEANYGGVNFHGPVTVSGFVSGKLLIVILQPGISGTTAPTQETLQQNASLPAWYPDHSICAD